MGGADPATSQPRPVQVIGVDELSEAGTGSSAAMWRERGLLVMQREGVLPRVCVKCGGEVGKWVAQKLEYHSPFLYLLKPLGIYDAVSKMVTRRVSVKVPLCEGHARRRRRLTVAAWLLIVAGAAVFVGGFMIWSLGLVWQQVAFVAGCVGAGVGVVMLRQVRRVVWVVAMDQQFVRLKGVGEAVLGRLPGER